AAGGCAGLSALTGGVRAASCNGAWSPARHQNRPRSGAHLGTSPALVRSAKAESPKPAIVRGALANMATIVTRYRSTPTTKMRTVLVNLVVFSELASFCPVRKDRLTPTTNMAVNTVNEMIGTNPFGTFTLIKLNTHAQTI